MTEEQLEKELEEMAINIWIEVCSEMGIPYKIAKQRGTTLLTEKSADVLVAKPVNEMDALRQQFGTSQQPAEFWYESAREEFYRRINL
jgi:hypothetical protein